MAEEQIQSPADSKEILKWFSGGEEPPENLTVTLIPEVGVIKITKKSEPPPTK